MSVVRWTFYDPNTTVTNTYSVNPNAGGTPELKKQTTSQRTTAGAKVIYFEGNTVPHTLQWSGTLLDEDQLDMFQEWFDKRHQILLTDDLGREYYIYITSFQIQRERARQHLWKHSYTMSASILDWPLEYHPELFAAAGIARGTGSAYGANDFPRPPAATGTGSAYDAYIFGSYGTATDAASGTGTAYNATVVVS